MIIAGLAMVLKQKDLYSLNKICHDQNVKYINPQKHYIRVKT